MVEMTFAGVREHSCGVEDFGYGDEGESVVRLSLAIFADRPGLRSELAADAIEAGFRIGRTGDLGVLCEGIVGAIGDIVLVDCPLIDAAVCAGLARLDMAVARNGGALIVATSLDALDAVFGCVDQSRSQILVGPGRAERLIALAQALAEQRGGRVRELSEADRMVLVRLTEQVNEIGARLERIRRSVDTRNAAGAGETARLPVESFGQGPSAFRFGLPTAADGADVATGSAAPALPDARLVRAIIRQRQMRARYFPEDLFSDPVWDMLLDLTAAREEGVDVSVTSLCIASGVPPTTALRLIAQMTALGLLCREEDKRDRRRAFIKLTDKAVDAISRYFAALGGEVAPVV